MTNEDFIKEISLEGEEWRDVVGYEGLYMVSSHGRCVSLNRVVVTKDKKALPIKQRILSATFDGHGYYIFQLWKNNTVRKISAHRLVAIAFIPNPCKYPEIDHIDNVHTNNHVDNLRWCTSSMNKMNPITRKNHSIAMKGRPNTAIMKTVVRINPLSKHDIKIYRSAIDTKADGFNWRQVGIICRKDRKVHTHKGYIWMFLSDYENLNINDVNVLLESGEE
jgi:hypothetical protein